MPRADYSRWDGSQVGFDFDADAVLAEVTDDLLYHGDLNAALRRMLQSGFRDRDGNRVPAAMQRMKDMLAELNHMLEQRERGEEPDFQGFMDRYGDFFPENPQNL